MKNNKIITVFVVFMMLSTQVHARGGLLSAAKDIIGDIAGVATLGLSKAVTSVASEILADAVYVGFMDQAIIKPLKNSLKPERFNNLLLQCNPDVMDETGNAKPIVANKVNFFIQLLLPFYFLAFLLLALYLLLVSSSPEGRAKAKGSLLRLILSAAVIIFTIPIIQALMDLSLYLTKFIITTNKGNIEIALMTLRAGIDGVWFHIWTTMPFNFWLILPLLLYIIVIAITPFLVIGLRYFMILIFTLLFPAGVFLYSIHFTRGIGRSIIRQSALWVFIQPLIAIIVAVIGITAGPLLKFIPDSTMQTGFGLAGFMALSAAPLMMIGILNFMEIALIAIEAAMEVPVVHIIASTEELEIKE
ncbi:MAG: hypothetical protein U9Q22_00640 [Candidatus Altiarchaeota archaeon]|nr:hypothetical protein [Candidatus Altiarchaeota archaeon]